MKKSMVVKIVLAVGIICSIALTYHTMIVQETYTVFLNPDGLPELDE